MRATIFAAALVALALPVSARAQEGVFASPYGAANLFAGVTNLTCYISNVGATPVRVRQLRIVGASGAPAAVDANTCGDQENFRLAPTKTCYIGADVDNFDFYYSACAARVEDASLLRGSLEHRNRDGDVLASIALIPPGGPATTAFERVASAPIFGGPDQENGFCQFTNFGSIAARVRNVEIVRSNGARAALESECATTGEATLAPGASCTFLVPFAEMRNKTDFQCRGEVTRKANVRGAMILTTGAGRNLNRAPLR